GRAEETWKMCIWQNGADNSAKDIRNTTLSVAERPPDTLSSFFSFLSCPPSAHKPPSQARSAGGLCFMTHPTSMHVDRALRVYLDLRVPEPRRTGNETFTVRDIVRLTQKYGTKRPHFYIVHIGHSSTPATQVNADIPTRDERRFVG